MQQILSGKRIVLQHSDGKFIGPPKLGHHAYSSGIFGLVNIIEAHDFKVARNAIDFAETYKRHNPTETLTVKTVQDIQLVDDVVMMLL